MERFELENKLLIIINYLYNRNGLGHTYDAILRCYWQWFPQDTAMSPTINRTLRRMREEGSLEVEYRGDKKVAFYLPVTPIKVKINPLIHWKKSEGDAE